MNMEPELFTSRNIVRERMPGYSEVRMGASRFSVVCSQCGHPDTRGPCDHERVLHDWLSMVEDSKGLT